MAGWVQVSRVQVAGRQWFLRALTMADYIELQQLASEEAGAPVKLNAWCELLAGYLESAEGKWQWLRRCVVNADGHRHGWTSWYARWRLYQQVRLDADAWLSIVLATDGLQDPRARPLGMVPECDMTFRWGAIFQKFCARWSWEPAAIGRLTPATGVELLTGEYDSGRIVARSWSEAERLVQWARERTSQREDELPQSKLRIRHRLEETFGQLLQWSAPAAVSQQFRVELPPGEWNAPLNRTEPAGSSRLPDSRGADFELGNQRRWARWIARQVVEQLVQETSLTQWVFKR